MKATNYNERKLHYCYRNQQITAFLIEMVMNSTSKILIDKKIFYEILIKIKKPEQRVLQIK